MNHYKLILKDKDSDAREEWTLNDPDQGRRPSTAAWVRASRDAEAWGRAHGFHCVLHEIADAVTGLSFGRHFLPVRYESDVDDGFHLLQDAANKFRLAGRTLLAERVEQLIESESLDSQTPGGR